MIEYIIRKGMARANQNLTCHKRPTGKITCSLLKTLTIRASGSKQEIRNYTKTMEVKMQTIRHLTMVTSALIALCLTAQAKTVVVSPYAMNGWKIAIQQGTGATAPICEFSDGPEPRLPVGRRSVCRHLTVIPTHCLRYM